MQTKNDIELLAVGGHILGVAMHGVFALWHWTTAGHRFDFWAKFNTLLAAICAGSIVVHVRRVLRGQ